MLERAARFESFTRAAEELKVTESAVSRQIQALEDRLGVSLFQRISKRVVLTPDGDRYVREIRNELQAIERATKYIASRAGGMEVIELAVVPTFATQWLIPRLPLFKERHPRIIVNMHSRPEIFHFLDSPFDAAIYFGEAPWSGHESIPLLSEGPSVPACSPAFQFAAEIRAPEELLRKPLLHLASRPDAWPDWFSPDDESLRRKASIGPRYELFSMVTRAAIGGLGVAVVPEMMIHDEIARGLLMALPLRSAAPGTSGGSYFLAHRPRLEGKVELFVDWLWEQCAGDAKCIRSNFSSMGKKDSLAT
ncbi:DNA-binding transcriptional LysR family regulator [Cupriavidus necator]|nr:LysR substrate-binding domain-containing protein [Cupriavidus necator]MDQ0141193.1 DNA-binding transcriptional LysR family regulator [Cupriavidus necator]